ncbi:SH3 domain-containing protein [Pediococcus pentosaceus]|uniref:SH3 domain-containing protein n=1 Tax=Pediococcus pentosaceus TaxID=1255 RepID=UPI0021C7886F|nr:SH3 domain-containing protein [Pediococcus pentosaceus]
MDQVAIRSSNSRTSKKIGTLNQYQTVSVLSKSNHWYHIRYDELKWAGFPNSLSPESIIALIRPNGIQPILVSYKNMIQWLDWKVRLPFDID